MSILNLMTEYSFLDNPIENKMRSSKTITSPKKLLHSKWTAAIPANKEKHFIVTKLILPALPDTPIEFIELEAVHSKRSQLLPWQQLNDTNKWLQGWL